MIAQGLSARAFAPVLRLDVVPLGAVGIVVMDRLLERGVADIEVYRILKTGYVMEEPERTERGEWKCKVVKQLRGQRELGVVTIIIEQNRLFVKTVEWED